ncbi:MAG: hypothetical protein AB7G80_03810 [Dongiaceae bacterium]
MLLENNPSELLSPLAAPKQPGISAGSKAPWKSWNPGLDNDDQTLAQAYQSLPGNDPGQIHWLVRLLENPKSKVALSGALELFDHDIVHILLGRGLLPQDESFVIGFTMGASSTAKFWERRLFKMVAHRFYPSIYRLNGDQIKVYDMAFDGAQSSECRDLHQISFKNYMDWKLGDLRSHLKIDKNYLRKLYAEEQRLIPGSKASQRLPL